MDRILGHKPAMHPSVVVDRLSQTIVEGSEYSHAEAIDVSNSYDSTDADIHLDESSCAGSSTLSRSSSVCTMPSLLTATTIDSENTTTVATTKKKGVKRPCERQGKSKRPQQMTDVMGSVVSMMDMRDSD